MDCLGEVSPDELWYHWVVCPEAQLVLTPAPPVGARVTVGVNGEEETPAPVPLPNEVEMVSPDPELSREELLSPPRNWVPRHLWDHQYGQRLVFCTVYLFTSGHLPCIL